MVREGSEVWNVSDMLIMGVTGWREEEEIAMEFITLPISSASPVAK